MASATDGNYYLYDCISFAGNDRYSDSAKKSRNDYLQSLINSTEDYNSNISDKSEEKITNEITSRQKYLESLASGATGTDATTSSN